MDFFIEDTAEKEEDRVLKDYITYVDVEAFRTQYLTSNEYNDPTLRNMGLFSLQRDGKVQVFGNQDNTVPKLR